MKRPKNSRIVDSWEGDIQYFGKSIFTVIGMCAEFPVIMVHQSEHHVQAEQCVIDWNSRKVIKFIGDSTPVDYDY